MRPAILLIGPVIGLVLSSCASGSGADDVTSATPSASPTAVAVPAPGQDGRVDLGALPSGPPPRLGYVDGTAFRSPDGVVTDLPGARRGGVSSVVVVADGLLVSDERWFEGSNGLQLVTATGTETLGPCTSGVGARDGDRLAYVTFSCPESGVPAPTLLHMRLEDGTETTYPIEVDPDTNVLSSIAGFLDGDVLVNRAFGTVGSQRYDQRGRVSKVAGVAWVSSVDEVGGLVVAELPRRDGAQAVVDTRTDQVLWHGDSLAGFSPDGGRLVRRSRDGSTTVVDARTGRPVLTLDLSPDIALDGLVWEDDEHILAVASSGAAECVVRVDGDGRITRVTPVRRLGPARSGPSGYLLETQP